LSDVTKQRELQEMRLDVMALVTHELRTPLTAIQGISEVLSQFEVDAGRLRQMHSAINQEAKRLARMIDEYLDLARLESGAHPMRLSYTRLDALLHRILLLLEPVAARRGIVIVRQFPATLSPVLADPDLITRALTNLVANAIKYTRSETEVTIRIRETPDTEEVEVSDHGIGITQDHLSRIFEKFYRVPRVDDTEPPGTGLGLAMVREIAERHDGSVIVESALGHGSTFRLLLPKSQQKPQPTSLPNFAALGGGGCGTTPSAQSQRSL
jgi:signal transduction histidine kinase